MSLDANLPCAPPETPPKAKRGKIFYGWWVVASAAVVQAVNSCVYFYGLPVFFTPLVEEFGWSRAALSGAFSIARLEAGIAGPLAGWSIDRWGPRRMMLIGLSMMSLGFVLLSQVQSLEMFYVIFLLFLSLGTGFGVAPPLSACVANWFVRKRGTALGLLMTGGGVGGALAGSLGLLIVAFGWRTALVIIGAIVLATGIPGALIMRHRPEPYGLRPDGDPPLPPPTSPVGGVAAAPATRGFLPAEALRTPAFWLLAVIFGARHLTTSGTIVHLPAMMVDRGYSLEVAAFIAGAVALASIPGRLLCGWLGDRVPMAKVFAGCMALIAFGLVVLIVGSTPLHLGIFVVAYGVAYGGAVPVTMAMVADYFGRRRYATIYGLTQFTMMWGSIGGPVLAGYAFDTTGSYALALQVFTAVAIVGTLVSLVVQPPIKPRGTFAPLGVGGRSG
ncbi:MAG: MFS transporter [Chloroflexota bacterium]